MLIDLRTPHPTPTPAEAAYLAYWRGWPVPLALPWTALTQQERRAWRQVAREMAQSVLTAKAVSLSLACCQPYPGGYDRNTRNHRRTDRRPGVSHYTTRFPKFGKRFDLLRGSNVLCARNRLDQLVKEPELVLPGGSVCSSKQVYLVKCNLCEEEKAVAFGNLQFPCQLKQTAPLKESLWAESHGGSKPNDWGLEQVDGRACRSVWSLASEPTPYAHFATFPTALVRRCLLAGAPTQVCAACGAPWRRVTETVGYQRMRWAPGVEQYHTQAKGAHGVTSSFSTGDVACKTTTGFSPTCACQHASMLATVLDPFCGSGTTLLVARELGHHAIGVDLSSPYLHDIARERLSLTALAAWQGSNGHPTPAPVYDDLPLFAAGGRA